MKKRLFRLSIICVILTACLFPGFNAQAKIRLNRKVLKMYVGDLEFLKVKGTKKKPKWIVKNKKIVKVYKASGGVWARKKGKTTIIVKIGKKKLKCKVIVRKRPNRNPDLKYKKKRNKILKQLKITKAMKDQYVCFLLSKWICDHVKYRDNYKSGSYQGQTYQEAFDKGTAVCAGYADTLNYLLDATKIKHRICISEFWNHALNEVKIDGKWYNIDVTMMDGTEDTGNPEADRYTMQHFLTPDELTALKKVGDGTRCKDRRFVKTVYEGILVAEKKHDLDIPHIKKYWTSDGEYIGGNILSGYTCLDCRCSPWFTGTWVNY